MLSMTWGGLLLNLLLTKLFKEGGGYKSFPMPVKSGKSGLCAITLLPLIYSNVAPDPRWTPIDFGVKVKVKLGVWMFLALQVNTMVNENYPTMDIYHLRQQIQTFYV